MDLTTHLTSVIHNVKNKLQLIQSSVDVVFTSQDHKTQVAGDEIRRGLMDVNQQLVALLGVYKLDQNKLVSTQEVHLAELLATCADYIPDTFTTKIDCDTDLVGFIDENLVKAVVSDAIHNAVTYADKQILLTAMAKEKGVVISVEDDGAGIRVENTNSKGTGLGNFFARQVAESHRNGEVYGDLELKTSSVLGGAAFLLYLP